MGLIPVKTPKFIKGIFPNYVWDMPLLDTKTIYLTFDDGPNPEITPWVLKTLEAYQAKATFFCIGDNIRKYPDTFEATIAAGHAIGNHTFNHLKGWKTNTETYIENVEKAAQLMSSKLFRPPYGKIKNKQAKLLKQQGYHIIMWSIISFDWDKDLLEEDCLKHVIKHAEDGHIIVFHDSLKAAKNMQYALPKVLEYYSKKGYQFKSLSV
ncbi:polysaccharide deacetylase family protein [Formosa algae]|uniref:Peptidoglycan/xylan/chitin deacetylase (PgdA/CDA1 family) n=1 Tax=Formosa algae TaxID=225843 RepID=A0A9X0YHH4_9FLAO|nr:polysaccharide deacetylase family protein [Formosa algae]MBP1838389.1 peptidoglycan/xylan/chitin deacetylase (PgdA/CDA1 family) [Formosa algae]MDQ0334524.1 peptidoglycan/xylan/chitin deacetylase (PgdA/CDA1 family) [Formosa algae]OEI79071.1 polysaccharide deacetylase [Formosa algae]